MATHITFKNAASRVVSLLENAAATNGDSAFVDAWAKIFEVPGNLEQTRRETQVSRLITALASQIEAIQAALTAQQVPHDLIEMPIRRVLNMLALGHLRATWNGVNILQQDVIISYKWFAHVLPADGEKLDSTAFAELEALLIDLEKIARQNQLPTALSTYLERVIEDIKIAISFIPVSGIEPLRQAVGKAIFEASFEKEKLKSAVESIPVETSQTAISVLSQTLKIAAAVSGDLVKMEKFLKIASGDNEWLPKLLG
ncbi:hypothetical protein [Variovorax sp. W1I1]|uniref:hypothetical protein n=1 Tax=Variovorax sp. W1I1 TaxID=3042309 RepID=UPI0027D80E49|nr:hypothetical protein [Variovorax sp. W1I1]